jgi:hypothetical protein
LKVLCWKVFGDLGILAIKSKKPWKIKNTAIFAILIGD